MASAVARLLGMAGEIAVPQGVPRSQQRDIALAPQQITQGVPGELVGVLKGFDQPLLLAFI